MARSDSARQEESIGTTLVSNGGVLTPKQQGFVRGGVGRPLNWGPGGFQGMGSGTLFPTPPPWLLRLFWGPWSALALPRRSALGFQWLVRLSLAFCLLALQVVCRFGAAPSPSFYSLRKGYGQHRARRIRQSAWQLARLLIP